MNINVYFFMVCSMFYFLAGCTDTGKFKAIQQINIPDADKAEIFRAAEAVLGDMHFAIDKSDAQEGVIRTQPLTGGQFFEFWRDDNVGSFNLAEANLHTIRRIVELNITQQDNQLRIGCSVKVQRLSIPERQVSSAHTYGMFSKSKSSMQRLKLDTAQRRAMAWIDAGEDNRLSTEILKRLEIRIDSKAGKEL